MCSCRLAPLGLLGPGEDLYDQRLRSPSSLRAGGSKGTRSQQVFGPGSCPALPCPGEGMMLLLRWKVERLCLIAVLWVFLREGQVYPPPALEHNAAN